MDLDLGGNQESFAGAVEKPEKEAWAKCTASIRLCVTKRSS